MIVTLISAASAPTSAMRAVPTGANRQPAVAWYLRRPGDTAHRALTLDVLSFADGLISDIVTFPPSVFPAFGLPEALP